MPLYVAALRLSNQLNKCIVWDVVKCRQSFGQIVAKQKLYYANVSHWTLMEAGLFQVIPSHSMFQWSSRLYMLKVVNNTTRYKKNVYSRY